MASNLPVSQTASVPASVSTQGPSTGPGMLFSAPPPVTTVTPPRKAVIDLTQSPETLQTSPSKPPLPPLPASLSQMPQTGTKRSPSPNFLSSLQSGRGRSPSPVVTSKSQSSNFLHPRSRSPGPSSLQHSHNDSTMSHESGPYPVKRKRLFHRELISMMRGFGGDPNPYAETVDLIEEMVIRFITEMTQRAIDVGRTGRVQVNDVIFIIRKDRKKYARVKDLLMMKEQIDKAKKAFTEDTETSDE